MKRIAAVLLLALTCSGCFESDVSLYGTTKPLQPFGDSNSITSRDKDGHLSHLRLRKTAAGTYNLTNADRGKDFGKGFRLRFFPLAGSPLLIAEVKECDGDTASCSANSGWMYVLVKSEPRAAEWRTPDCSAALSKLAAITVKTDNCTFADRISLEKALSVAAAMPWKADGAYQLH